MSRRSVNYSSELRERAARMVADSRAGEVHQRAQSRPHDLWARAGSETDLRVQSQQSCSPDRSAA